MNELLTDIKYLKGIGPKKAFTLQTVGVRTFGDLLNYFPRRYLDRSLIKSIAALQEGETATVVGEIRNIRLEGTSWKNKRLIVSLHDKTGKLELTWFQGAQYLIKNFKSGEALAVNGKVGMFNKQPQMLHPDFDRLSSPEPGETHSTPDDAASEAIKNDATPNDYEPSDYDLFNTGKIIPLYTITDAMKKSFLTNRSLRKIIRGLLDKHLSAIAENLPAYLVDEQGLMHLRDAFEHIHFPASLETLEQATFRLKWTELFYTQILFALRKRETEEKVHSVRFEKVGEFTNRFYKALPFEMTNAQKKVIKEIRHDLGSGYQMNRLVQGDVGSGKTIVAIFSMMIALDNGAQCAFMAPTEILATQHYITLKKYLEPLGVKVSLLIGKQRKKLREEILQSIATGETHIAVGTHALIEEKVQFQNLGLAIIDEQHRFGVLQRKTLQDKALNPHILLMTATPIPRTLTMTLYGDLDVSIIDEMPKDRKPIMTYLRHDTERDEVYTFIKEEIRKGRQAYIVYPLVEESEKVDLQAASEGYEQLKAEVFDECRVGLIHGRLFPYEKEDAMEEFRNGKTRVLVGTTVIEVGVDVPNASVMMIVHAERFGLSQLHQLRGRVGRGAEQSYCFLMYSNKRTSDAKERLFAMEATTDGFKISETDLKLRGAGNILGKEQSGSITDLKIADLNLDTEILASAREAAFAVVANDKHLRDPANQAIRDYYLAHFHKRYSLADVG
ncbi:MAG: ATP-dependent DNA helicase RecG [Rhizobacter sp.]|nr:ATP-dependent DNA helicase RecG [Chlorobiales bacterium]